MLKITRDEFRALADAAVSAVGWTEGWCDDHPSWVVSKVGDVVGASPAFRANFRKELRKKGVSITRKARPA